MIWWLEPLTITSGIIMILSLPLSWLLSKFKDHWAMSLPSIIPAIVMCLVGVAYVGQYIIAFIVCLIRLVWGCYG